MEAPTHLGAAELRAQVAKLLDIDADSIPADANLVGLGLTSLGLMRFSSMLRRAGVPVTFEAMVAEPTLEAWQQHIGDVQRTGSDDE